MALFLSGVFVSTIFAGAFAFNIGFDVAVSKFWDNWNRGVSQPSTRRMFKLHPRTFFLQQRQWKDIRDRYIQDTDAS